MKFVYVVYRRIPDTGVAPALVTPVGTFEQRWDAEDYCALRQRDSDEHAKGWDYFIKEEPV